MCKLLLMTGLKNPDLIEAWMKDASRTMTVGNNMGIGYTAVKNDGEFFTERWHDNDKFFNRKDVRSEEDALVLATYKNKLPQWTNIDQNYSLFGSPDFKNVTSVTMHTRLS